MQADGRRDLERSGNRGDPGDAYPGTSNNRTFNATSKPNSNAYSNAASCVAVTGIGASGPSMTMQIQVQCPAGQRAPSQAAAMATAVAMAAGPAMPAPPGAAQAKGAAKRKPPPGQGTPA